MAECFILYSWTAQTSKYEKELWIDIYVQFSELKVKVLWHSSIIVWNAMSEYDHTELSQNSKTKNYSTRRSQSLHTRVYVRIAAGIHLVLFEIFIIAENR